MRKTLHIVVTSLILLCAWGVSGVLAQSGTKRPFITKWRGEAGKELVLPIFGTEYKLVIKNAKGEVVKSEEKLTRENLKFPYAFTPDADGVYTVEAGPEGVKFMQMVKPHIGIEQSIPISSSEALLEVVQFGTVKWVDMCDMFYNCRNMTFASGIDTPDLSNVTDMEEMFYDCSSFNQPLGNWDVSNVTYMRKMFRGCSSFNQPLNNWNVSKVTHMSWMFINCRSFNQPLGNWDVSNVTNMENMFAGCSSFNQPLEKWDVSKVNDMSGMFAGCSSFNQPLNNWDVSKVTRMYGMFSGCSSFNQPIDKWDVSNVTNMSNMFSGCAAFNQPLDNWNVSKVTRMDEMFEGCSSFNQPLDNWNVSNVTNMGGMFFGCSAFNQPLNNWDVSKVTLMYRMFYSCRSFNQPLNKWNVSKVTNMQEMFSSCRSFNQPLGNWDVSKVTSMENMFYGCSSFNQPLDNWNVSNMKDMRTMFEGCSSFNQPLGSWKIKTAVGELSTTAMSPSNYSQTLVGWAEQTDITNNLDFRDNVKGLIYNDQGKEARQKLIDKGWKFEGDIHQPSGVSITPYFFPLILNKECTLPLDKWGVEETEEVTLSTNKEGIISYELTADKKGVHIKGLKEGTCKLTATIAAKPGVHEQAYTSTCEIEVYIPIERFTITPAKITMEYGWSYNLKANIFPENATKREVKWECSSGNAPVSSDGVVNAYQIGKYTVYAEIKEYRRTVYEICEVNVEKESAPVTSITLLEKQTLTVGTTIPLIAVVKPDNAKQGLVWSSSDPEIATVSEGFVWGKKKGTCTITVKSIDQDCAITKECKITVEESGNGGNNGGGDNNGSNPTTFSVTLTRPTNGKIEIEGHATKSSITVAKDTELTVKATPDEGYKLKTLKANNKDITTTLKFIVKAATEVKAVFEKETFAVTPSVNNEAWGSIELTGAADLTAVAYGTELTVKVTEKEGYKLKSLTAGDKDITTALKFIVKAATEVKAVFESKQGGAVEDALLAGIVVVPNPFSSQLRILNPEGVVARYEVVNGAGVVVRSGALSGTEVIVDTEALSAGIYFVRLEAQNGARKSITVSK